MSATKRSKSTTLERKVPQFDGDLGPNISHKNVSYDKKYQISFPGTGKANGPFSPTNIVLNSIILNFMRKRVKIFVAGRIWDVKFVP